MTFQVFPDNRAERLVSDDVAQLGGISKFLEKNGRMPPVSITLKPLDGSGDVSLDRFLTYRFTSSIRIPVDSFDFTFVAPDDPKPLNQRIKDGDLVSLFGAGQQLATGIIDSTDLEVDREFGERVALHGRDLMGQLEDQDAVSISDEPIWGNSETVSSGIRKLITNTRIANDIVLREAPGSGGWLLATEPGESKLAALQRFLEPMNCLAWMSASGKLIIGRPNMKQEPSGRLICSKTDRQRTNVLSMKVVRSATSIPNIMLPIWSGQETVQARVTKSQRVENKAAGPTRLRRFGHRVPKSVVVSNPQGSDPASLSDVNQIKAGGSNRLQAYALRELARRNTDEMIVQTTIPGHYNDAGNPYLPDQVYFIDFERGDVFEKMYLFQVDYELSADRGQITNLYFCRLGTLVSEVIVR